MKHTLKVAVGQKGQLRLIGANLTYIFFHFLRKTVWFYQVCSIFPKQAVHCCDLKVGEMDTQNLRMLLKTSGKSLKLRSKMKCVYITCKIF